MISTEPNKLVFAQIQQDEICKIQHSQPQNLTSPVKITLPETNGEFTPENGWLEY